MTPVLAIADEHGRGDLPEGAFEAMLDHSMRSDVRDMIRLYGFEEARQRIAEILLDECSRKVRQ